MSNNWTQEQIQTAKEFLSYHKATPLPKQTNKKPPYLIVFRHGQSEDNEKYLFSGWRNPNLTKLGEEQALILSEKLKDIKVDLAYTSDLTRSIQTYEIALSKNLNFKNIPVIQDKRLRERSYGILQGKSKIDLYLTDFEQLQLARRSYDFAVPQGESIKTTCERVHPILVEIVEKMKSENINVAVSCHSNSIREFRRVFEHLNNEQTALIETSLAQDYALYSLEEFRL